MLNSSRVHLERLIERFAHSCPNDCLVLDAGAGEQPYRCYFTHVRYESADSALGDKAYAPSTYICDLNAIPVSDARFDRVICTQVLEHVPDPMAVLRELHRVLKPGGLAFFTMPLFYEEHEVPNDYFRFTQFGLRRLFADAAFAVDRVDWLEGYFGSVAYQMRTVAIYLPWRPGHFGAGVAGLLIGLRLILLKAIARWAAHLMSKLDLKYRVIDRGFPINYVVLARKL